jgi:hypothetical protein
MRTAALAKVASSPVTLAPRKTTLRHQMSKATPGRWTVYGRRQMTFDLNKNSDSNRRLSDYVNNKKTNEGDSMVEHEFQTSEPGPAAVHVPSAMGNDKKTAKKKMPNARFMQRMMVSMMERYTDEEVAAMKKTAAAHAGGMTKAERAKLACMDNELYAEAAEDNSDEDSQEADDKEFAGQPSSSYLGGNASDKIPAMSHQVLGKWFGSNAKKKDVLAQIKANDDPTSAYQLAKDLGVPTKYPGVERKAIPLSALRQHLAKRVELVYSNLGRNNLGLGDSTTGAGGDNCGTGKGGFAPGNTCAAKKAVEDDFDEFLMAEFGEDDSESLTARLAEIQTAFRKWATITNLKPGQWPEVTYYTREVFTDYVIAESTADGDLYKIPFTEGVLTGEIEFGDAVRVTAQYVPVMATEVADLCTDGHGWQLFVEHEFAEAPEWMPLLPKPGNYVHPKYGDIKLSKARNASFAAGVNKKIYQSSLPVNAEHAPGNDGAHGWIEEARLNADGSVDARVTWTDLGKEAIEKDRFRYISPEWADEFEAPDGKKITDVIRGAALTVRPFFKDKQLRPLVASERGWSVCDSPTPGGDGQSSQVYFFTALEPSEPTSKSGTNSNKEPKQMADKDNNNAQEGANKKAVEATTVDAQKFAELEDRFAALEAENLANKTAAEAQAAEVKMLSETNAKLTDEAETKRFTEEVEGKTKASKYAYVGDPGQHVKHLKSLAKAFGEDSEELKFYLQTQRQAATIASQSLLMTELGNSGVENETTAYGKLTALAKARKAEKPSLSFEQAFTEIISAPEHKELYTRYTEEGN